MRKYRRGLSRTLVACLLGMVGSAWTQETEDPFSRPPAPIAENASLFDRLGRRHPLTSLIERKGKYAAIAFVDSATDVRSPVFADMVELERKYRSEPIAFLAVYSDPETSVPLMAAHAMDAQLSWMVFKDLYAELARAVGVTKLPTFLIIDQAGQVIFKGPLGTGNQPGLVTSLAELAAGSAISAGDVPLEGRDARFVGVDTTRYRTFVDNVYPILESRCHSCHQKEGLAPFGLTRYRDVIDRAEKIGLAIETHSMPPWPADDRFGRFSNHRRITAAEEEIILDWIRSGKGMGDVKKLPLTETTAPRWSFADPDWVFQVPEAIEIPAEGEAFSRRIEIPEQATREILAQDRWMERFESKVVGGLATKSIQYHVVKPGQSPPPVGTLGTFAWLPGNPSIQFPGGTAYRIPAGSRLVLDLFFLPNGSASREQPTFAVKFSPIEPVKEVLIEVIVDASLRVGRFDPHANSSTSWVLQQEVDLLGVIPFMQGRAKEFLLSATSTEDDDIRLLMIPRFHPLYQNAFWYEEAVHLPIDTTLRMDGTFNNSVLNPLNPDPSADVTFGVDPRKGMLAAWIVTAVPRQTVGTTPVCLRPATAEEIGDANAKVEGQALSLKEYAAAGASLTNLGESAGRPVRIEITKAEKDKPWTVQMVGEPFDAAEGKRYFVRFQARADQPRRMSCVLGSAKTSELASEHRAVTLSTEWSPIVTEFVAQKTLPGTAIHLYVGDDPTGVEVQELQLEVLDETSTSTWKTRVRPGCSAVVRRIRRAGLMRERLDLSGNVGNDPYQVALDTTSVVSVTEGERYVLTFRARSDSPRSLLVTLTQNHPPGKSVGLFRQIGLYRQWEQFSISMKSPDTDTGTIVFFVGGSAVGIEIADLKMEKASDSLKLD